MLKISILDLDAAGGIHVFANTSCNICRGSNCINNFKYMCDLHFKTQPCGIKGENVSFLSSIAKSFSPLKGVYIA